MRSSSSEGEDEDVDVMFPESSHLSNMSQKIDFLGAPFANISPPPSQDPSHAQSTIEDAMSTTNSVHDGPGTGFAHSSEGDPVTKAKRDSAWEREPGWSWNNRKSKEEYERTREQVQNRDFSLGLFSEKIECVCALIQSKRNLETCMKMWTSQTISDAFLFFGTNISSKGDRNWDRNRIKITHHDFAERPRRIFVG